MASTIIETKLPTTDSEPTRAGWVRVLPEEKPHENPGQIGTIPGNGREVRAAPLPLHKRLVEDVRNLFSRIAKGFNDFALIVFSLSQLDSRSWKHLIEYGFEHGVMAHLGLAGHLMKNPLIIVMAVCVGTQELFTGKLFT